jgi:hypothetical protein
LLCERTKKSRPFFPTVTSWTADPGGAVEVGVEAAAKPAVGGDVEHADALDGPPRQEWMNRFDAALLGCKPSENDAQLVGVGPRLEGAILGSPHLRRRDQLHGVGDLRGVADSGDAPAKLSDRWHRLSVLRGEAGRTP